MRLPFILWGNSSGKVLQTKKRYEKKDMANEGSFLQELWHLLQELWHIGIPNDRSQVEYRGISVTGTLNTLNLLKKQTRIS